MNCKTEICDNCGTNIKGKIYCMLCEIGISEDLQMEPPDMVRDSKPRGFVSTVSVKLDKETG